MLSVTDLETCLIDVVLLSRVGKQIKQKNMMIFVKFERDGYDIPIKNTKIS